MGALPVLPADDAAEAPDFALDDIAFDDAAIGDEDIILINDEDLAFINLPIGFDEMVEGIDWSEGFDPSLLWQSMGVDPAAGGEGVLDPAAGGEGVVDPNFVPGDGAEGEPVDGEVEVMAEDDPRIYYSGVGVNTAGGDAGTPAPVSLPVAELGEETSPIEVTLRAPETIVVPTPVSIADSAPEITVPETVPLATAPAPIEHDIAAIETPDHAAVTATLDQDVQLEVTVAPAAAIDHWVPADVSTESSLIAIDAVPLAADAEQVIEIDVEHDAPDAGAVSHNATLRHGAMAAALTGSVLLSRDAQKRPQKSTR
jgi:hypothetical protein